MTGSSSSSWSSIPGLINVAIVVGRALLLAVLVTAHFWLITGIGVGLTMARGHNDTNENSTNGDNDISSKTSRLFYTHLVSIYSALLFSCQSSS